MLSNLADIASHRPRFVWLFVMLAATIAILVVRHPRHRHHRGHRGLTQIGRCVERIPMVPAMVIDPMPTLAPPTSFARMPVMAPADSVPAFYDAR